MAFIEKIFRLEDLPVIADLLLPHISNTSTICLYGDIGSGKTTLCKELISRFGIDKNIIESPTFVRLYVYEGLIPLVHYANDQKANNQLSNSIIINHYDLYRIENKLDLYSLGIHDDIGKKLCIIEWAERIQDLPHDTIKIYLEYIDENSRKITIWQQNI